MPPPAPKQEIDYQALSQQLSSENQNSIYPAIVNVPFSNKVDMDLLFLGFICLYIVDENTEQIQLKAASGTEEYRLAVEHFNFNLDEYRLDFEKNKSNTIVQAIVTNKPQSTTDWVTLSRGETPDETVRLNQANSGIAYTAVYPLLAPAHGCLMFNYYQYQEHLGDNQQPFMEKYTKLVSELLSSDSLRA